MSSKSIKVNLKTKKLKDNRLSVYLRLYNPVTQKRKKEYLGLYLSDYILVCDDAEFSEIWFSPEFNNLGYDYHSGVRLAFYDIVRVEQ